MVGLLNLSIANMTTFYNFRTNRTITGATKMKMIVRTFALALVVTGAVASAHTTNSTSSVAALSGRSMALPVPMCPPDDPNGCGIGQLGK